VSSRSELRRLRRRRVPAWWSDAKLGIFVHWTPASVVGWAPVDVQIGDLIAHLISDSADLKIDQQQISEKTSTII
jgi:hypothetical protein